MIMQACINWILVIIQRGLRYTKISKYFLTIKQVGTLSYMVLFSSGNKANASGLGCGQLET